MKLKLRQTPLLHMLLKVFMGRDLLMIVTLWLYFGSISAEAHTISYFQEMKTSFFFTLQLCAKQEVSP